MYDPCVGNCAPIICLYPSDLEAGVVKAAQKSKWVPSKRAATKSLKLILHSLTRACIKLGVHAIHNEFLAASWSRANDTSGVTT